MLPLELLSYRETPGSSSLNRMCWAVERLLSAALLILPSSICFKKELRSSTDEFTRASDVAIEIGRSSLLYCIMRFLIIAGGGGTFICSRDLYPKVLSCL